MLRTEGDYPEAQAECRSLPCYHWIWVTYYVKHRNSVCASLAVKNVILSFSLGSLMASPSRRNVLGAATIWVHRAAQVSLSHPVRPMEKPVGPLSRTFQVNERKIRGREKKRQYFFSWLIFRKTGGRKWTLFLPCQRTE